MNQPHFFSSKTPSSTSATVAANGREHYQHELNALQDSLLNLASMVDKEIHLAVYTLKTRNLQQAKQVIESDNQINFRRYQLEEEALTLLATQQPVVSHDLRMIAAVMNMAGELERMGDYAKGIARINERLTFDVPTTIIITFEEMATKCREMLKEALDCFIRRDAARAATVASADDEIDVLYNEAYHNLLRGLLNDPKSVDEATMLLWAAHNLERMGDRITNICERIIFVETGRLEDFHGPMQV